MITMPIDGMQGATVSFTGKSASMSRPSKAPPGLSAKDVETVLSPQDEEDVRVAVSPQATERNPDSLNNADDQDPSERITRQIQERIEQFNARTTSVSFQVDYENDEVVVKVLSRESGEVIRQIPPEELIKMRRTFEDIRGMLVNKTH